MSFKILAVAALAALAIATIGGPVASAATGPTVFVAGLNNPRGLTFDAHGTLFVAEGGAGGTQSTIGQCVQVIPPVGPYTGGPTARISKISPTGVRTTVVAGLPSGADGPFVGRSVIGVADVKFVDGQLEALIAGAGCSHGNPNTVNSVIRVNGNGSTSMVADLSAFLAAHPVARVDATDEEPDGTWFSMVAAGETIFALEPNHQELVRISEHGSVSRVVDFSANPAFDPSLGKWQGPTAIARRNGSLFVGTLTEFPIVPGAAQVLKVNPRTGQFSVFATNLTTILGLAFDRSGALYVVETSTAPGLPAPGQGQIIKIRGNQRTTIATGLNVPTGIAVGPDHNLYVSVNSFGAPPGFGAVLKIPVPSDAQDDEEGNIDD